ncbi:MAG: hypothetical protein EF812_02430 [Methanosarcinales archaeon]|nr:MAG: hypothetical protein EF812_02430 [Methanosarcinales archaeon]
MHVGSLREYKILSFRVFPLQYRPALEERVLYEHIVLNVTYAMPRFTPAPVTVNPEKGEDKKLYLRCEDCVGHEMDTSWWRYRYRSTS